MKFFLLMAWVLLLSWATHFVASPTWRTPSTSIELLSNADAQLPANWTSNGLESEIVASADGAIHIDREIDKHGRVWQKIALPDDAKLLRLQATLSTDTPAAKRFARNLRSPAVLFMRVLEGSQRYPLSVRPMFFQSNVKLDEVVELTRPQESIELSFSKPRQAAWQLSKVSLSVVEQHPRYEVSRYFLAGLWLVTLCLGIYRAGRRAPIPTVVVLGVLSGMLGAFLASKDSVNQLFIVLKKSMNNLGGDISAGQFGSLTQSGHIILFAILAFVVLVFHKRWSLFYSEVIVGIGVLAIATEALQRHVLGRSPDIQDFLFDVFGIFVGLMIFGVLRASYKLVKRLGGEPS